MKFIVKIVVITAVVFALPSFIPGIAVSDIYAALWVSLVLAGINLLIKPLISLLTMPLSIITLGLFGLVVNGALLYFVPAVVSGFAIDTFLAAFLGALVISLVNWLISKL